MPEQFRELPKESTEGNEHTADFGEHKIDVYKLIEASKSLETEEVDIESLKNFRDNSYWYDTNGNWIQPGQIIDAMKQYDYATGWDRIIEEHPEWKEEVEKIKKADYEKYPIILIGDIIIDGIHRLTKACIEGRAQIKVKRFDKLPEETILSK
jgi:glutaredoxin